MRCAIVLRNEFEDIVGIGGHFIGPPKLLALSVLLGVVRRRMNMMHATLFENPLNITFEFGSIIGPN
jgi:hypothetical protein